MKKTILLLLILTAGLPLKGQSLIGGWEMSGTFDDGVNYKATIIFTEKFQSATFYEAETGAFISSNGGKWWINDNKVTEQVEFDSENSESVGGKISFKIEWTGSDQVKIAGMEESMTRLDSGEPGALAGAWLMSVRKKNGEFERRNTDKPRKTMKILSGTKFQWIAYNTETKEFLGTGGGSYSTESGIYTENIEFFSKDNSKVGVSLPFNFELIDDNWHHSGNNSRGKPLYEIWSLRSE